MSQNAYQNFTYTCLNSAAWYDASSASYANAIKLQGDNEEEFSIQNNKPNVLLDGCKVKQRLQTEEGTGAGRGPGGKASKYTIYANFDASLKKLFVNIL